MFQENRDHLQGHLISTLNELPDETREMLEQSWAGTFRQEIFMRLDEKPFAVLYSDKASRPNVPVNVLLSLEILKAGHGWSDEELYQAFLFNLQVRYAVGYEQLSDGYFGIRTLYEFRHRLRAYMQVSGENLIEQAFAQITDQQMQDLAVKSDKLRMDSTLIASHICQYSRLQLLVEILHRVQRMLSPSDQDRYTELLGPYVEKAADHYVYRLSYDERDTRLGAIGPVMATLVEALATDYAAEPTYALLVRIFQEHFTDRAGKPHLKAYAEVGAASLQAPDDPEATYRRKGNQSYRGYVTNITETCHPDNDLQLVVKVQTEPNATDDAQMLIDALPDLVARTDVTELYTDGGYNSPHVDPVLNEASPQGPIDHIQRSLRGDTPHTDTLALLDFTLYTDGADRPTTLVCPREQTILVEPGTASHRFIARPDPQTCTVCPLLQKCPVRPRPTAKTPALYFDHRTFLVALKRQAIATRTTTEGNLRAAVEATIRSVKNPFRQGKVLVRGRFRVASLMLTSALMVNLRRIHRYLTTQRHQPPTLPQVLALGLAIAPFHWSFSSRSRTHPTFSPSQAFFNGFAAILQNLHASWPFPFRCPNTNFTRVFSQ